MAIAPAGLGSSRGDLLVGNFGDGLINVFDSTGAYLGSLGTVGGTPAHEQWAVGLEIRQRRQWRAGQFTVHHGGLNDEQDGLFAQNHGGARSPEPGCCWPADSPRWL